MDTVKPLGLMSLAAVFPHLLGENGIDYDITSLKSRYYSSNTFEVDLTKPAAGKKMEHWLVTFADLAQHIKKIRFRHRIRWYDECESWWWDGEGVMTATIQADGTVDFATAQDGYFDDDTCTCTIEDRLKSVSLCLRMQRAIRWDTYPALVQAMLGFASLVDQDNRKYKQLDGEPAADCGLCGGERVFWTRTSK